MTWGVEFTDQFRDWFIGLDDDAQVEVRAVIGLLEDDGPTLKFPRSSGIEGSQHGHMRELRVQSTGKPLRALYAFDPRRVAILLVGGDKTGEGDKRFYRRMIPIADQIYDEHLAGLRRRGKIK